jgi:hypothetical protein
MVLHPLLLTHDRIEAFGVEVAIVHLMAARTQSRDDLLMQRGPEARDDWIRVQNKNAQRRAPSYVLTASGLSSVRRTTATNDRANRFPKLAERR